MAKASEDYENMEDRVQIFMLFAHAVDDRADSVGDAARKQQPETRHADCGNHGFNCKDQQKY